MNYSNVRFNFRRAAPPCTSRREQAVPAFQSLNVVRGSCYESRQEERRQTRGEVGASVAARTPYHQLFFILLGGARDWERNDPKSRLAIPFVL